MFQRAAIASLLGSCLWAMTPGAKLMAPMDKAMDPKISALHEQLLTLDTHCDTPMRMERGFDVGQRHEVGLRASGAQDLIRMKEGGLDASFFAVFLGQGPRNAEGYVKAKTRALQTLDQMDEVFKKYPALCERALQARDASRIAALGKRAIFLGLENGYPLGLDVSNVDLFYQRGVRYITLTHTAHNDLASSSSDESGTPDGGLTEFGRAVVSRMNDLGMMVDVSHISDRGFDDVLKISRTPVLASHSCARALCDHPRNLTDNQLRALKANRGVIQVCVLGEYVKKIDENSARSKAYRDLRKRVYALGGWGSIKDPKVIQGFEKEWHELDYKFRSDLPSVSDFVDHIDHIVKVIGIDHVGIGTDFDGGGALRDCSDVTHLSRITAELVKRGYKKAQLEKIWGGNALRVMAAVEKATKKSGKMISTTDGTENTDASTVWYPNDHDLARFVSLR